MKTSHTIAQIGDSEVLIPHTFGHYEFIKIIGYGAFSVVALVQHKTTGAQYASKICSREILIEMEAFERFERELRIMQSLKHPNIVCLEDIVFDDNLIYLIMEYCEKGELFQYIIDQRKLNEPFARKMFSQIVNGLIYIHTRNIAHRDIKPENIFLDSDLNAKIGDFGLCFSGKLDLLKTPCGSPFYAAPEVVAGEEYDGKMSDIWSLGVVLFTMVTGSLPWKDMNQTALFLQIENADFVIPRFVSSDCRDLLMMLMSKNPSERPTAVEILSHPWVMAYSTPEETKQFGFLDKHRDSTFPASTFVKKKLPVIVRPSELRTTQTGHVLIRRVPRISASLTRK
jgi:serine/threonine protein kinase